MADKHAELMKIGESAFASIAELVKAYVDANDGQDCELQDSTREAIEQDPLSLRIFGERDSELRWEATSFELLLATGGPAVRIVGDLDRYGSPVNPRLEVQDWFTPWTEYPCDQDALQAYCDCFYMGDQ